ncbi:hypothetical protein G7068_02425 [Leucobacter viscericola]|uniref:Uncharacterized protein n=1 Tax=Leucobacter viscericola TaxID=2714935 RepID=A0A6G7XCT3_9MICO|nr:hypothetical protein [Leucobacter viscericola]QIK62181.1 hypothetical protein G7068_02425 [Leucobacter viscericola]
MRTRSVILPLVLTVAFALFVPSFWMIDVFQSQTPEAMIVTSDQPSTSSAAAGAPWSVADEGSDDLDPFTPLTPPHVPLSATALSMDPVILPPPMQITQVDFNLRDALPPSASQEVPTTPPLPQA